MKIANLELPEPSENRTLNLPNLNSLFNDLNNLPGFSDVDPCKRNVLKISPNIDDTKVLYKATAFHNNVFFLNWGQGHCNR